MLDPDPDEMNADPQPWFVGPPDPFVRGTDPDPSVVKQK
jgi:hypothetical protein